MRRHSFRDLCEPSERFVPFLRSGAIPHAEGKTYFNVPFEQKEVARGAGLRWDPAVRKWYAPNTEIAESFFASACQKIIAPTVHERFHFAVPFLQKGQAKSMGMRFDGMRKCWFAEGTAMAALAACLFRLKNESVTQNQPT